MSLLVSGVGVDPTGVEDSSAAVQAKVDALPADGGDLYFPPGSYRFADIEVTKPLTIRGAGHHGMAVDAIPTRLLTDSATADMFQIDAGGVSMQDVALINDRGTAPTAGAGLAVASGYFLNLTRVAVIGFYDNVTIDDAWLYNFTDCHFHDGVRDYVRLGNSVNSDVGGGVIQGCSFTPAFHARTARAFCRWEAGGGLRFIGNKMNGDNNMDPLNIVQVPPTNGLDMVVGDGVLTIDMLIASNSIERMGNAGIRCVLAAGATGQLRYVMIQNNQTLGGDYAVAINPSVTGKISDIIIGGNVFYAAAVAGILANNVNRLTIDPNTHDYAGSAAVTPVSIGSGVTNLDMHPQKVNGDGIPILSNASEDTAGAAAGMIDHRYQRGITNITSAVSYTTLWRFTPVNNRGGIIRLALTGIVSGVGPFVYRAEYLYTRAGAVTLSQVEAPVTAGAAIDVDLDVAAVSGEIQVKVRRNSAGGGTAVNGRCDITLEGAISAVRKGA